MNAKQNEKIEQLYFEYKQIIKPLLAQIEATYEKFPIPLFNEIRAFNDHISRCYGKVSSIEIDTQLNKAKSHINRMILDCYKFLNIYYNDKIINFENKIKRIDITTINNGEFYINYKKLREKIIKQVKKAKENEQKAILCTDYTDYEQAYNLYVELDDFIMDNFSNVNWARSKFYTGKIMSYLGWIVSFVLTCILANNNEKILATISTLFK